MHATLTRHPATTCEAVDGIDVALVPVRETDLRIRYTVRGDIAAVVLPRATAPERADELWKRTCFEAFVRAAGSEAYTEFNFSPSTRWAAYHFDTYREGARSADVVMPPRISVTVSPSVLVVDVALARDDLPASFCRMGLSAVIEEAQGRVSYWAIRHPTGKPDFHHADGFAMELPARGGA
jgi:hypothetical protein